MRLVELPYPAQGAHPADGPLLPGTDAPLTSCSPRAITCHELPWKWMGAPRAPALPCPSWAEPQPTPHRQGWRGGEGGGDPRGDGAQGGQFLWTGTQSTSCLWAPSSLHWYIHF